MVHSNAPTVDAYLAQASPRRAAELRQVRELARRTLDDHDERIQWGMPVYAKCDQIRFGFADRREYISLYFMNTGVLVRNPKAFAGKSRGKSCVRFRRSDAIDWSELETLLRQTRAAPSPAAALVSPR
jgi:hypothetical protein